MKVGNPSLLAGAVQNPLIVSSGMIGYWSLNDGTGSIAKDFCGNASFTNGTFTGVGALPTWGDGAVGSGVKLSQSIAYVSIPDSAYLRPGSGDFSVSLWFNAPANLNQNGTIICKRENGPTYNQFNIAVGYTDGAGSGIGGKMVSLFTYFGSGGGYNSWYTTTWQIDSNWHHMVVLRPASGNPSIYIDGRSQALTNPTAPLYVHNINNTLPWLIGYWNGAGVGASLTGSADQIRFYNRLLTQSEITALYNERDGQLHALAKNWAMRTVQNGSLYPSASTITVLSDFCKGLDAAGLTSKMKVVNCFVPDSLIASITPLVKNFGNDPWTNVNFVAGDLTVNGLLGNKSNKYLRTGILASATFASVNDNGLTVYVQSGSNSTEREISVYQSNNQASAILVDYSDTTYYDCYTDGGTGRVQVLTPTTLGVGFYSGNRISAVSESIYVANSAYSFASVAGPGGSPGTLLPTTEYYIFAQNLGGNPANVSGKRISFAAIHSGLSAADAQTFFNLIQTMRTSLGGGYV